MSALTVKEAIRMIEEAEERLRQARELLRPAAEEASGEDWPGGRILAEVLAEGGSVARERLYQIAARHRMDRRGLGGFFRASGRGSLYEVPGMDRIILTPSGTEIARKMLEKEESLSYQAPETAYAKVAERSFAEDWDSEEDSTYDRL